MYKTLLVSLVVVLTIGIAPALAAPHFISSDAGIINITSPLGDDTYIGGGQVTVDRNIDGDLFIGGGNVEVKGNVAGDLFVGAGTVMVTGNIGDDLRVGGGQVRISGTVGDDVLVGAGFLVIGKDAIIRGDLITGSGNFSLDGEVKGNVKASFGEGVINGTIGGDASLRYRDDLTFGSQAIITGKLTYRAPQENPDFGRMASSVEYHKWAQQINLPALGALAFLMPVLTFSALAWKYLGMLVLGGLLIWLLPKYMPRVAQSIKKNYWTALWQGFLVFIIVPILAIIAAITLIGLPVSFVLGLSYVVAMIIAGIIASLVIGSYFVKADEKSKPRQFGALAVGAIIYVLLGIVPFVGGFIKLVFLLFGLGGIWQDCYALIKSGKY